VQGHRIFAAALRLRVPRLLGWTCFALALLTFTSDRHRPLFGRWSYTAFGAILCTCAYGALIVRSSWRTYRSGDPRPLLSHRLSVWARVSCDVAFLLWGAGYLLATLDVPSNAGQVLDLNLFGSTTPAAIVLFWLSLVALGFAVCSWVAARSADAALSLSTLMLLALVGEGTFRARAIVEPLTQGFPTYSSGLWSRRYVRLNREGFRDTEHSLISVPGTHRLLLVGDSFAFGVGIRRTSDRLGEQLGVLLDLATGEPWEVFNISHPDRNTVEEIAMLDSTIAFRPKVVVLVYVFNDIDYLYPITERGALTEAPQSVWQRIHPARLLFENSFLFQEVFVRARSTYWSRHLAWRQHEPRYDPYADSALVGKHLTDLSRFVAKGKAAGALVGIVPLDPAVVLDSQRKRYESFCRQALAAGLPVWRVDSTFDGFTTRQLAVNTLDGHPNELANRLVANRVGERVLGVLQRTLPRSR